MNNKKGTLNVTLTGFGPFMSVTDNPSDKLVKLMESEFPSHFQNTQINLFHTEVISVDQTSVDNTISKIKEKVLYNKGLNSDDKYLMLHFAGKIHLERNCVNKKCFKDGGNEFTTEKCIDGFCPGGGKIETCLPLDKVKREFEELDYGDFPCVEISEHAGTYLCNYIYYVSTREFSQLGIPSLFIHIPNDHKGLNSLKMCIFTIIHKLNSEPNGVNFQSPNPPMTQNYAPAEVQTRNFPQNNPFDNAGRTPFDDEITSPVVGYFTLHGIKYDFNITEFWISENREIHGKGIDKQSNYIIQGSLLNNNQIIFKKIYPRILNELNYVIFNGVLDSENFIKGQWNSPLDNNSGIFEIELISKIYSLRTEVNNFEKLHLCFWDNDVIFGNWNTFLIFGSSKAKSVIFDLNLKEGVVKFQSSDFEIRNSGYVKLSGKWFDWTGRSGDFSLVEEGEVKKGKKRDDLGWGNDGFEQAYHPIYGTISHKI